MRRLASLNAHATESYGGCQNEGIMPGSRDRGQSGVSVMGPPDKKLTDGVCALWEKG